MPIPAPFVFVQGEGAVTADNLNTLLQAGLLAPQLRTITGLPGMTMMLAGIDALDDGAAGFFFWNAAGTEADDNYTYIVPNGTTGGLWERLTFPLEGNAQQAINETTPAEFLLTPSVTGQQPRTLLGNNPLGPALQDSLGNLTSQTVLSSAGTQTLGVIAALANSSYQNYIAATAPAAWAPLTTYALGALVQNNGIAYVCSVAGESAGSGGPTGTGASITDGSATWSYCGLWLFLQGGSWTQLNPQNPSIVNFGAFPTPSGSYINQQSAWDGARSMLLANGGGSLFVPYIGPYYSFYLNGFDLPANSTLYALAGNEASLPHMIQDPTFTPSNPNYVPALSINNGASASTASSGRVGSRIENIVVRACGNQSGSKAFSAQHASHFVLDAVKTAVGNIGFELLQCQDFSTYDTVANNANYAYSLEVGINDSTNCSSMFHPAAESYFNRAFQAIGTQVLGNDTPHTINVVGGKFETGIAPQASGTNEAVYLQDCTSIAFYGGNITIDNSAAPLNANYALMRVGTGVRSLQIRGMDFVVGSALASYLDSLLCFDETSYGNTSGGIKGARIDFTPYTQSLCATALVNFKTGVVTNSTITVADGQLSGSTVFVEATGVAGTGVITTDNTNTVQGKFYVSTLPTGSGGSVVFTDTITGDTLTIGAPFASGGAGTTTFQINGPTGNVLQILPGSGNLQTPNAYIAKTLTVKDASTSATQSIIMDGSGNFEMSSAQTDNGVYYPTSIQLGTGAITIPANCSRVMILSSSTISALAITLPTTPTALVNGAFPLEILTDAIITTVTWPNSSIVNGAALPSTLAAGGRVPLLYSQVNTKYLHSSNV